MRLPHLHAKQKVALETTATEILYGGAAGGGKSFLMRIAAILWCATIPGLQVYLFRRIYDDLIKNHMEGPKGFRALLSTWEAAGWCQIVDDQIRFWNGSKIYLCHCQHDKDRFKYQGAEIHVLLIDELTHFSETVYRFLRNRVRMVGIALPAQYVGKFPRILCGANPGNIGHLWVKNTFVTSAKPLEKRLMPSNEGGMIRQYIPARLEDNPSMAADDPGYEARLEGLGGAALVKAMRWGDWDVIEGAFFDCWASHRHVIKPFTVPADWDRFRSGDWGSAKPFSFGWWAIVRDDYPTGQGITLPRGCLLRYREWYGCKEGQPNVGLKLYAEKVGAGIWQREEKDPPMQYGVLDPAAFAQDGGPSIAERITTGSGERVHFTEADNKRVPGRGALGGWDQVRSRLVGEAEDRPMIAFFETCADTIRTVPALQHDPVRPEDLDTDGEDHAADDIRYGCMSRPWVKASKDKQEAQRDGYASAAETYTEDSFMTM